MGRKCLRLQCNSMEVTASPTGESRAKVADEMNPALDRNGPSITPVLRKWLEVLGWEWPWIK